MTTQSTFTAPMNNNVSVKGGNRFLIAIQTARLLPATIAALIMIVVSAIFKPFDPLSPISNAFGEENYRFSVLASFVASLPLWADYIVDVYHIYLSRHGFDRPKQLASDATVVLTLLLSVSVVNICIFSFTGYLSDRDKVFITAIIFSQFGFLLAVALIGMNDNVAGSTSAHSRNNNKKKTMKMTIKHILSKPFSDSLKYMLHGVMNPRYVVRWSSSTRAISFVGTAVTVALLYFESIAHSDDPVDNHPYEHSLWGGKRVSKVYVASVTAFVATAVWMFYKVTLILRYRRSFFPGIDKGNYTQFQCFLVFATVYFVIFFGYLIYWAVNDFGTWVGLTGVELAGVTWCQTAMMLIMIIVPGKINRHAQHSELKMVRALNRERKLNLALIDQMFPPKVAAQLRSGKPLLPESYEDVTIFFSDVEGFTKMSAAVEPIKVVQFLNELYTVMDHCAALFPLYKVETIGDAYMVVSGLPEYDPDHVENMANFSLVVQRAVSAVRNPLDGKPTRIRMGIHHGPVVAGVVGNLMPRYCLFGETVNLSSRMESTGEAGRLHCSEAVAKVLIERGHHILSERGMTDVKGKGKMKTYWIEKATDDNVEANEAAITRACEMIKELLKASNNSIGTTPMTYPAIAENEAADAAAEDPNNNNNNNNNNNEEDEEEGPRKYTTTIKQSSDNFPSSPRFKNFPSSPSFTMTERFRSMSLKIQRDRSSSFSSFRAAAGSNNKGGGAGGHGGDKDPPLSIVDDVHSQQQPYNTPLSAAAAAATSILNSFHYMHSSNTNTPMTLRSAFRSASSIGGAGLFSRQNSENSPSTSSKLSPSLSPKKKPSARGLFTTPSSYPTRPQKKLSSIGSSNYDDHSSAGGREHHDPGDLLLQSVNDNDPSDIIADDQGDYNSTSYYHDGATHVKFLAEQQLQLALQQQPAPATGGAPLPVIPETHHHRHMSAMPCHGNHILGHRDDSSSTSDDTRPTPPSCNLDMVAYGYNIDKGAAVVFNKDVSKVESEESGKMTKPPFVSIVYCSSSPASCNDNHHSSITCAAGDHIGLVPPHHVGVLPSAKTPPHSVVIDSSSCNDSRLGSCDSAGLSGTMVGGRADSYDSCSCSYLTDSGSERLQALLHPLSDEDVHHHHHQQQEQQQGEEQGYHFTAPPPDVMLLAEGAGGDVTQAQSHPVAAMTSSSQSLPVTLSLTLPADSNSNSNCNCGLTPTTTYNTHSDDTASSETTTIVPDKPVSLPPSSPPPTAITDAASPTSASVQKRLNSMAAAITNIKTSFVQRATGRSRTSSLVCVGDDDNYAAAAAAAAAAALQDPSTMVPVDDGIVGVGTMAGIVGGTATTAFVSTLPSRLSRVYLPSLSSSASASTAATTATGTTTATTTAAGTLAATTGAVNSSTGTKGGMASSASILFHVAASVITGSLPASTAASRRGSCGDHRHGETHDNAAAAQDLLAGNNSPGGTALTPQRKKLVLFSNRNSTPIDAIATDQYSSRCTTAAGSSNIGNANNSSSIFGGGGCGSPVTNRKKSIGSQKLDELNNTARSRVLVVDDSLPSLKIVSKELRRNRFVVTEACNGLEAIERVKESDGGFDIIVLDYNMPVMNGIEAARHIRQMESQGLCGRHFIVGITADDDPDVPNNAAEAGMDCCMSKPFRLNMFIDILEQHGSEWAI